jgi:hypothetical protein
MGRRGFRRYLAHLLWAAPLGVLCPWRGLPPYVAVAVLFGASVVAATIVELLRARRDERRWREGMRRQLSGG